MEQFVDVVIIGAGVAGMSAAVYASRAGLDTIMLDSGAPGGKLLKTNEISNWTGTPESSGVDLAMKMFDHSTKFGAKYAYGNVVRIIDGKEKQVICEDGTIYHTKAIIVATGTKERLMGIKGEQEYIGKGISYCAVCDAAFYKNREVVVIGGGNAALEEAVYLTQFADKVTIVMRRNVFRAEKLAIDAVLNHPKIEILQNYEPIEILGDGKVVTGIKIRHTKTNEEIELATSGIFPYIGADPITDFLKEYDIMDEQGYLLVNEYMETKCDMIYGAGDVNHKVLRQVVTAASDGAIAAQSAFHKIRG